MRVCFVRVHVHVSISMTLLILVLLKWIPHSHFICLCVASLPHILHLSLSLSLCASLPCSPSYNTLYEITHSIQSISEFVECNPGNLSGSFILNQSRERYSSVGSIFSTALKRKIISFIKIFYFHIMNVINNDYWPQSIGSQTCICISHYGWDRLPALPQFKSTVITLSSRTGLLWFSITTAML